MKYIIRAKFKFKNRYVGNLFYKKGKACLGKIGPFVTIDNINEAQFMTLTKSRNILKNLKKGSYSSVYNNFKICLIN